MKTIYFVFIFLSCTHLMGQSSENLIPRDAVTVFSINNINLLQKISIDELIQYDFMQEIHQELFDGSTNQKTLKDAGIDFDQKLNVFYGKDLSYEISGFTFGVKNKDLLFQVFDDFEKLESPYEDVLIFGSFFNNLIIKNQSALLVRVEPIHEKVDEITDSIWYSRGNTSPYFYDPYYDEEQEVIEEEEVFTPDELSMDILAKTYDELRDSVQFVLQQSYFNHVMDELFIQNLNLITQDNRFKEQLSHDCEGIFYMDEARNFEKTNNLWYLKTVLPSIYQDIQELYEGNVIIGDLFLKDKAIQFNITTKYGEKLGSIYQEMNDSKFDKNITKYIKKDHSAFFTYNINLRKAYDKTFEVIMPILSSEKNADISMNVLTLKLINEFINKDALFDTYKGSMFGTFNGIQKIKTKKIEFFYDEETFEYGERETEAYEDMPIFTVGFSTNRSDIPEMILEHLSQLTSKFQKFEDYWLYEDAILDAAPLYLLSKNDLFIVTNDEDLVKNHSDGYGSQALSKKATKELKKAGFMNGFIDIEATAKKFPTELLNGEQQEIIEALKGNSGKMNLRSSATSTTQTNLSLEYTYEGNENSGKHLLELINTMYLLSK